MALTYSQGYKGLLNGQSIKSISSSCPLRDPGDVCCVLRGSTKKGKPSSQEAHSLWMMNVRNQTWAKCVVCGSNFLLSYSSENKCTAVLCFTAVKKKRSIYQNSSFSPVLHFSKALGTFRRQDNINILTATVKPGQGHHKYHVTFTVHIPLDSCE